MFYAGIDMLFSILFPILFLVVLGMILYTIIGNISTWNKNNHSPRLTVPATVVASCGKAHGSFSPPYGQYDGAYVHDLLCDLSGGKRRPHGTYRKWFGLRNACGGRHWKAEFSGHPLSWIRAELNIPVQFDKSKLCAQKRASSLTGGMPVQ